MNLVFSRRFRSAASSLLCELLRLVDVHSIKKSQKTTSKSYVKTAAKALNLSYELFSITFWEKLAQNLMLRYISIVITPNKVHLSDWSTGEFTVNSPIFWEPCENEFPTWVDSHSTLLIVLWLDSEIWKWALYSHLNNLIKCSKLNNWGHIRMTNSLVHRGYACYLPPYIGLNMRTEKVSYCL